MVNITENKKKYLNYYDNQDLIEYAIKIFRPFMLEWGYKIPKTWSNKRIRNFEFILYKFYNNIFNLIIKYNLNREIIRYFRSCYFYKIKHFLVNFITK